MNQPTPIRSSIVREPLVIVASRVALDHVASVTKFCRLVDPNLGANQILDGDWLRGELLAFDRFVLLMPPGAEAFRDDLAIRLGDDRCLWRTWRPGSDEDAGTAIALARPMWNDEIATIDDIPDEGDQRTFETGFPMLDDHGLRITLPAFMPVIGPYGSGKSVFLRQLLVNLWRLHGWKCLLTSFEERVKPNYVRDLRRHLIGKPMEHWTDRDEAEADTEIRKGFVFLRRKRMFALDADHLLDRIEFAVRVHGVRVIAIDPFNEIEGGPSKGESKTDYVGRVLMRLKALADDYGLLVIVLAHPPKDGVAKRMQDGALLTLNDGADSAHWGNKADIGLCVWRKLDGATLLHIDKTKVHEVNGKPGLAEMSFSPSLGRFEVVKMGYDAILGEAV